MVYEPPYILVCVYTNLYIHRKVNYRCFSNQYSPNINNYQTSSRGWLLQPHDHLDMHIYIMYYPNPHCCSWIIPIYCSWINHCSISFGLIIIYIYIFKYLIICIYIYYRSKGFPKDFIRRYLDPSSMCIVDRRSIPQTRQKSKILFNSGKIHFYLFGRNMGQLYMST